MNDVLNTYLTLGLLDIGDDDSRLSLLRAAATDLAKRFAEEPREALYHALTVFSLTPPADEASYVETGSALETHWSTYRNRFKDKPREVLKPISFLALQIAASENKTLAYALGYLLRTIPPITNPTREQTVLSEFAKSLEDELENHAVAQWSVAAQRDPVPIATVQAPIVSKIDRAALSALIIAASGPNNVQNEAIPGANPSWPSGTPVWTAEFGKQLSEAVASNMEQALLRLSKEYQKQLNGAIAEVNSQLLVNHQTASFERRTQMLWWQKSGYSSQMGKAYSDMPKAVALVVMVVEFHKLVGGVSPYSAEYFLRNTVQAYCDSEQIKLSDLFEASQGPAKNLLEGLPVKFTDRKGSKTLFETLLSGKNASPEPKGAKRNEPLAPGALAVRLFNEFQALTLAQTARQAGR